MYKGRCLSAPRDGCHREREPSLLASSDFLKEASRQDLLAHIKKCHTNQTNHACESALWPLIRDFCQRLPGSLLCQSRQQFIHTLLVHLNTVIASLPEMGVSSLYVRYPWMQVSSSDEGLF